MSRRSGFPLRLGLGEYALIFVLGVGVILAFLVVLLIAVALVAGIRVLWGAG